MTPRAASRAVLACLLLAGVPAFGVLAQEPPPLKSHEVHEDRSVTFRFRAPNAQEVELDFEGADRRPMQKGEDGVWSLTIGPLEPDLYGYAFVADGVTLFDPANPVQKKNFIYVSSLLHVPGPASLPWEVADVPHGRLHEHFYRSSVVGDERDFYVYTPPGYDEGKQAYPVLYLLHGYSDDASAWTAVGRAHVILDNLIAQGKVRPMLVVMPLGYGAPEILNRTEGWRDPSLAGRNVSKFKDALLKEVIPRVEKAYRVKKDRESRAIAGLSMGGGESLFTGLNAIDRFAWIGAFSSAVADDPDKAYPDLNEKTAARLRLLWIACGRDDFLHERNRSFEAWLQAKGIRFTPIETPGKHTWMVWRRNLAAFAPLLFR
jgi:enterochelin esterase-like enzyme